ncbi:hypothetical protein M501DRAFT_987061 [Patellaria atrata CBS 101060]|uniref:Uncharacterized protein n=1 Tax=Patellaria atrata CBS 101060 TaxID=1346257 RepID=A0A9P4S5Z7_9PEZI|nr:hypothetical protein M501DRAFT_987061 [Patellaria atrata CBS 101060]
MAGTQAREMLSAGSMVVHAWLRARTRVVFWFWVSPRRSQNARTEPIATPLWMLDCLYSTVRGLGWGGDVPEADEKEDAEPDLRLRCHLEGPDGGLREEEDGGLEGTGLGVEGPGFLYGDTNEEVLEEGGDGEEEDEYAAVLG